LPRFFTDNVDSDIIYINGDDARHITRSLRMREGERLTVCDGAGLECECTIARFEGESVVLEVTQRRQSENEASCRVTLYQGCPKGDKLELIVEKAVELGAARIVPVVTGRSVSRPDAKAAAKKSERLSRHALEAAKQCGRAVIPTVGDFITFSDLLRLIPQHETCVFFYEEGGIPLSEIVEKTAKDVAIIIGPEGGFEPSEAQEATDAGAVAATLGKRILRTETAAVAGVASVMLLTGGLD